MTVGSKFRFAGIDTEFEITSVEEDAVWYDPPVGITVRGPVQMYLVKDRRGIKLTGNKGGVAATSSSSSSVPSAQALKP